MFIRWAMVIFILAFSLFEAPGIQAQDFETLEFVNFKDSAGQKLQLVRFNMVDELIGYGIDRWDLTNKRFSVYKTENGGAVWTLTHTNMVTLHGEHDICDFRVLPNGEMIWMHASPRGEIYQACIYLSDDEGLTWPNIGPSIGFYTDGFSPVNKCVYGVDTLWLVTNPVGNTVQSTTNMGQTWYSTTMGVEAVNLAGEFGFAALCGQLRNGQGLEPPTTYMYDQIAGQWSSKANVLPPDFILHRAYGYPISDDQTTISLVDRESDFTPKYYLLGSTDGGGGFKTFYTGTADDTDFVFQRGIVLTDDIAYLCGQVTENGETKFQIRKTVDGGQSWSILVNRTLDGAFGVFRSDAQGRLRCDIGLNQEANFIGYYNLGYLADSEAEPNDRQPVGAWNIGPLTSTPSSRLAGR